MATESNITHRVASFPLYRLPAEASFAMTLDLTGYSPSGKYIELTAQKRYGASQVWRTATTDDTPAISISGSTVTIEITRDRASVDDETLDFSDLGSNVAFAVVFRDSSSDPADFVLQGDLDFLPDRGDFTPGTAASTSVALTVTDGSTVNVEVLGVIEGEDGAVLSVNGRTGAVTLASSDVGLGNVENTADADKPISSATQSALDGKASTAQGAKADTALQPGDVVNDLTTGGVAVPGSAAQLVVLKGLIDNINTLLVSDETTLDTLQEIVDFIELNRADLDALGISSIAGLQSALDLKAASSHNHTLSDVTDAGTSASLDVPATGDAAVGEVVKGDDSRLTDARTPTSHTHTMSDITDAGGLATEDDVEGTAVKSTGETGGLKFLREDGDGTCSWQTIAGGGDMLASTYDPGSVSEQLVGLSAAQTLTNKTLTTPTITLKQGTAPAPTAEGDIQWDTDDNQIKVGDGAATKVFSDDSQLATAAQGALADSALQSADIDTLAELNAILTDATLIDTNDSRLSDARTPTAHSHTLSDITDAGTAAASDIGDFEASGAVSTHAAITSGVHGISTFGASLIDDADAATARTTLGVDAAGTDNSTDVTLAGSLDYLSLSGQEITLGSVDLTTDVTGTLPAANGGTGVTALASLNLNALGSGAATDGYVATADGSGGVAWEAASGGGGISTGKAIAMAIVFG